MQSTSRSTPSPIALTPYSPFFLSGLVHHEPRSYLDLESLRSYYPGSLKRKPSSLNTGLTSRRLRQRPSLDSNPSSLRSMPSPKPVPHSPLPIKPLSESRTVNTNGTPRFSMASTVPSSYKRRKRTDALATLEGRIKPAVFRDFMSMSDDEEDDQAEEDHHAHNGNPLPHYLQQQEDLDNDDAAEFYGSVLPLVTDRPPSPLSSLDIVLSVIPGPALEAEDCVLPHSPLPEPELILAQSVHPSPAPRLPSPPLPSASTYPSRDHRVSFLPLSPSSSPGSSERTLDRVSQVTLDLSVSHLSPASSAWDNIPFYTPFTFDDLDCDFSLPPRPAPTPDTYSPSSRPARRSEDDLPLTSELVEKQILERQESVLSSSSSSRRTQSRTRTYSTPPSRSASRRRKKGGAQQHHLKSFIEFDLRSSISSKPSSQALNASYWSKDSAPHPPHLSSSSS